MIRHSVGGLAGRLFVVLFFIGAMHPAVNRSPVEADKQASSLGFSAERLKWLHLAMQDAVDQGKLPGLVTILARHGQIVEERSYGKKNLATGAAMTSDTIFRIFSMTKPVTGVAMMMLYEEGKWQPSDPISKFIPEFAHLKVFKSVDPAGNMVLEEPAHAPTMGELMTHTAGFSYGLFGASPVDKMYLEQRVLASASLPDMIAKLARIPLLYQPGSRWVYSVSTDIQGYVVERMSGQTLPEFLEQRIFHPLHMKDTAFFVPENKRSQFAVLYGEDQNGNLVPNSSEGNSPATNYSAPPTMPSGGGGLVSTAEDYLRFSQMLLNRGSLDGVRILAPATVKLMLSNHLPPSLMTGEFFIGPWVFRPGMGFGYDGAVFSDPLSADEIVGKGTFFWSGSAGTWFWIDPENDLIFIGMTQRMFGPNGLVMEQKSRPPVYGALVNP